MKLIHCADLHLDSRLSANLDKDKAKERKTELLLTFQRMVDYARSENVSGILIAGDLFDVRNISVHARNTVRDAILENPAITFFYLRGNHDADGFLNEFSEIPENLKLFGDKWISYDLGDRVTVTGLELNHANSARAYVELLPKAGRFNIVMLHGQESETDVKDKAEVINLRALRNKSIDYLALGHIHAYKAEPLDGRAMYCYPGCLEGRGFDECGEHGFVLLDIDEIAGTCVHRFVPFASRKLFCIETDVSDCSSTGEIAQAMRAAVAECGAENRDLLKVVLTGRMNVECEPDLRFLCKVFEEDYFYIKIYDERGFTVDYRDYSGDMSLKGEFVRSVLADIALTEEEKAEVIRYGIRAITGEEVGE